MNKDLELMALKNHFIHLSSDRQCRIWHLLNIIYKFQVKNDVTIIPFSNNSIRIIESQIKTFECISDTKHIYLQELTNMITSFSIYTEIKSLTTKTMRISRVIQEFKSLTLIDKKLAAFILLLNAFTIHNLVDKVDIYLKSADKNFAQTIGISRRLDEILPNLSDQCLHKYTNIDYVPNEEDEHPYHHIIDFKYCELNDEGAELVRYLMNNIINI